MIQTANFYWYGIAAAIYIAACWTFAAVRWFHTCKEPEERRRKIWPDRKLQCIIYLMPTLLIPYVLDPTNPAAWLLYKSYFPACYYFYSGILLFCFFGTLQQWNQWKSTSWVAAVFTILTMTPFVINAWVPGGMLRASGISLWSRVVPVVSAGMMVYAALSMYQVWQWMKQARDDNYSNPEDFPMDYARRVWLAPVLFTPLLWPAYLMDSPAVRAASDVLLSVAVVLMLLQVLPVWHRTPFVTDDTTTDAYDGSSSSDDDESHDDLAQERYDRIASEIAAFVEGDHAFLDPHLRLEHVVDHCSYSRSYVSAVLSARFGGFSNYVNKFRLTHFEQYKADHPNETGEAAAEASGYTSYRAYLRAKEKTA